MLAGQNILHTVLLLLPAPQHCWQVDGMQQVVEDAPVLAGCCQGPDCPRELRLKLREPLASPCSFWRFTKQAALCWAAAPQQLLQC